MSTCENRRMKMKTKTEKVYRVEGRLPGGGWLVLGVVYAANEKAALKKAANWKTDCDELRVFQTATHWH